VGGEEPAIALGILQVEAAESLVDGRMGVACCGAEGVPGGTDRRRGSVQGKFLG
jgi:hypothetical protein